MKTYYDTEFKEMSPRTRLIGAICIGSIGITMIIYSLLYMSETIIQISERAQYLNINKGLISLFGCGIFFSGLGIGDLTLIITKKKPSSYSVNIASYIMLISFILAITPLMATNLIAKPILESKGYTYCAKASDTVQIGTYEYLYASSYEGCLELEARKNN
ncbi:MAG: hypothetical protein VX185_12385 [Pseudomonadota bacterium]|nr:hypothetical protein [Pseudomonadota bacterium]